jgi:pimeloyl-ACP methyl ester carboxylesterase
VSTPPFVDRPAGVDQVRVPVGRGELAALVAGPDPAAATAGSPAVLVPGFTGSKEDFIAVLGPLAAAGHRVVALDLRGQFESPGDGDATSYDVTSLAEDVLAVARSLGRPVHLLGHSFGGLVARAAALADPAALRSLTVMGSGPAAVPHPAASNLQLIAQALPVMDLPTIWAAKRELESQVEPVSPDPHIEEFLHRRFLSNDPVCLLRMAEQLLTETDRVDEVAALGLPTLAVWGPDDDTWPPTLQADMARRLGARTAVVEGSGHSPAADRPAETAAALVEFWAEVDASSPRADRTGRQATGSASPDHGSAGATAADPAGQTRR